ncbi:antA/AntB antirepressor family protein [Chitinilyticum aquatile]|uniref:antA/AntB antirepressor family protein n=1 Tax=Chitinilyticum aquatile TaxID=362520 RepID=UPI00048F4755|nr:antA/AntB antirepressor family protein [Chitinilyticum aquatile]
MQHRKHAQTGKTLTVLSRNITKRRFVQEGLGTAADWDNLRKYRCKLAFMDDAQDGCTVSARELHKALDSKRKFTDWIAYRFDQLKPVEGSDYLNHKFVKQIRKKAGSTGSITLDDYLLTPELSKHIAMMEGTDAGMVVRSYFIWCERVARKFQPYNLIRAGRFTELDKELKHELAKRGFTGKTELVHRELCQIVTGLTPAEWEQHTGQRPRDEMSLTDQARYQDAYAFVVNLIRAGLKWSVVKSLLSQNKKLRVDSGPYLGLALADEF